ncbi:uncharacterized protein PgNI_02445 [Pyricularia grisea]|uniref:Uncharacterized protein n=1 Tax=Pyricularia grisea TaxID=148305 RepID=A0A6P8BLF1_PYRGI|nr:uncharacterized protein PgNI_02445 [Pyricularia grisea]TLD17706.1 hypothetical protein PgNI_02445 [Pyricularia grisea]
MEGGPQVLQSMWSLSPQPTISFISLIKSVFTGSSFSTQTTFPYYCFGPLFASSSNFAACWFCVLSQAARQSQRTVEVNYNNHHYPLHEKGEPNPGVLRRITNTFPLRWRKETILGNFLIWILSMGTLANIAFGSMDKRYDDQQTPVDGMESILLEDVYCWHQKELRH